MIGRHGEGLKLAALAFLRNSKPMRLESGTMSVEFDLLPDDISDQLTLHFKVSDLLMSTNKTLITVSNIEADKFAQIRKTVLLFRNVQACVPATDFEKGSLLIGAAEEGMVFVNGILVKSMEANCRFGVNLTNVKLDRDRQGFSESECGSMVWELIVDVALQVAAGKELWMHDGRSFMDELYGLISSYPCSRRGCNMPHAIADILFAKFQQEHGNHLQPVSERYDNLYDCDVVKVPHCMHCALECSSKYTARALPTWDLPAKSWSPIRQNQHFSVAAKLPEGALTVEKVRLYVTGKSK
eukprot:TRINITY_DN47547_c0_g1_i1.p1 TRINITY_DN47547_c0_g1~~TRINITY_DN47547_c0_g1_i1.p1  ORF type:complete len:298 (-),score=43.05 TRINITY_DN47547_c0_g1_i1:175-1068(-)